MRPLLSLLMSLICAVVFAAGTAKPDILFIMPDQWRGDALSVLDHPVVRTPQLDKLARAGTLFRRAYATVPSCIPARYALLTGLYAQTSGVVGFAAKPITTIPTLPGVLSASGYRTVLVGREMHQVPASGSCGYQEMVLGSTYRSSDDYDKFLQSRAPGTTGIREIINQLGVTTNFWQAKPWPLADELHPSAWIVEQSRKIVADTSASQPLFLTTSFYAPHPPLFPPKKFFESVASRKLPQPAHGGWVDWASLSPEGNKQRDRVLLEGQALHAAQAGYFGSMEQIDFLIGPLVAEFTARSEKAGRPWVVVFTTDHGEMLGDHGYFRKCEPYEGSANIPFIVAGSPGLGLKTGQRIEQPVCLEDLMPTLLSLAGTKPPAPVDGVDLVPTLRGDKQAIREWLHFEHAPTYNKEQSFQALTDGRIKYIWRPLDGSEQLFDLVKDPREEHDLSKDAAMNGKLQEWRQRLIARLQNRPEGFAQGGKLVAGRTYKPLNVGTPR